MVDLLRTCAYCSLKPFSWCPSKDVEDARKCPVVKDYESSESSWPQLASLGNRNTKANVETRSTSVVDFFLHLLTSFLEFHHRNSWRLMLLEVSDHNRRKVSYVGRTLFSEVKGQIWWRPCHVAWLPVSHRFITALQVCWSGCTGWRNPSIHLASGGAAKFHLFPRGTWYLFFQYSAYKPVGCPSWCYSARYGGRRPIRWGRWKILLKSFESRCLGHFELCRFLTCWLFNIFWHFCWPFTTAKDLFDALQWAPQAVAAAAHAGQREEEWCEQNPHLPMLAN